MLFFYKKIRRDEGLSIAKYLKTYLYILTSSRICGLKSVSSYRGFHPFEWGRDRGIDRAMSAGPISIGNRV